AVALYVPMHTATRIAVHATRRVRALNPQARLCAYGLYAPMNADLLRELGVEKIIGGEFEQELVSWLDTGQVGAPFEPSVGLSGVVSLDRLSFLTPDRSTLPPRNKHAKLRMPTG